MLLLYRPVPQYLALVMLLLYLPVLLINIHIELEELTIQPASSGYQGYIVLVVVHDGSYITPHTHCITHEHHGAIYLDQS